MESLKFEHLVSLSKRIEFWIISQMLKQGIDVYVPLIDDQATDAIIRLLDGSFIEIQINAKSQYVAEGDGAFFSAISHEPKKNYWFIFYSERLETIWIMTSDEFIKESYQNKSGKNKDKRSIKFNGSKINKRTGKKEEFVKNSYLKYIETDFKRLLEF